MGNVPDEVQKMFNTEFGIKVGYNSVTNMLYYLEEYKSKLSQSSTATNNLISALQDTNSGRSSDKYGTIIFGYNLRGVKRGSVDGGQWDRTGGLYNRGVTQIDIADFDDNGTINPATEIVEENNYYPFGLKHKGYNQLPGDGYKYKFQEQERNEELGLNWDSFKWRNYDYAIGRFFNIDPLAEQYSYQSPYNFAENRVIDGRELEGLEWESIHNEDGSTTLQLTIQLYNQADLNEKQL